MPSSQPLPKPAGCVKLRRAAAPMRRLHFRRPALIVHKAFTREVRML